MFGTNWSQLVGGLRVRHADAIETFGLRQDTVNSAVVNVTGGAFVFGNDIQIRLKLPTGTTPATVGYIREMLPCWHYIQAPGGITYQLQFGAPGMVALETDGPSTTGLVTVAEVPALRLGASRALMVSGLDRPTCATPALASDRIWYQTEPTIGQPGCQAAVLTKLSSVQGVAGPTSMGPVVPIGPVYLNVTYQSPATGLMQGQMGSPIFIYFRANDISGPGTIGCDTDGVKLGDLSVLTTPISFSVVINHNVHEIGYYFAATEEESGVGAVYSQLDINVFTLLGAKSTPFGGGGTDMPIGIMRPNMPGTGFGYLNRSSF